MAPPLDRLRDLPSSSDLSFPQPVHESVCGTSLTTTGQDLSPRSSQDPPQQQGHRSDVSNKEHESGAPVSTLLYGRGRWLALLSSAPRTRPFTPYAAAAAPSGLGAAPAARPPFSINTPQRRFSGFSSHVPLPDVEL